MMKALGQFLARVTSLYKSLFCMSVSVIFFLGFSLVEMSVSGSGSGVPDQKFRVFVLFQLSTTCSKGVSTQATDD